MFHSHLRTRCKCSWVTTGSKSARCTLKWAAVVSYGIQRIYHSEWQNLANGTSEFGKICRGKLWALLLSDRCNFCQNQHDDCVTLLRHRVTYFVFKITLLSVFFSVLAKRLAGKSVSEIAYCVSSGLLNLNSINQLLSFCALLRRIISAYYYWLWLVIGLLVCPSCRCTLQKWLDW